MPLGNAEREIFVTAERSRAFAAVVAAGSAIGRVLDAEEPTGTVTVKTRYVLQSVKLRVSVLPEGDGSRIVISGASDDVWGGGARKGADKLVAALNHELA